MRVSIFVFAVCLSLLTQSQTSTQVESQAQTQAADPAEADLSDPPTLTDAQLALIQSRYDAGLPDPTGRVFVAVNDSLFSSASQLGWMDPDSLRVRVYDPNHKKIYPSYDRLLTGDCLVIDFEATIDVWLHPDRTSIFGDGGWYGLYDQHKRADYAAWAYRRGEIELAVRLLALIEDPHALIRQLDQEVLYDHIRNARKAFVDGNDHEAWLHLWGCGQGFDDELFKIAWDIRRRNRERSGSGWRFRPSDFHRWSTEARVDLLIQQLEHMQNIYPGEGGASGGFESHWIVIEFLHLGDAAVPALIDALANDHRLTRSHYESRHGWQGIMTARQAAGELLHLILVCHLTDDSLYHYDAHKLDEMLDDLATDLRAYWDDRKNDSFAQRPLNAFFEAHADERDAALQTLDRHLTSTRTGYEHTLRLTPEQLTRLAELGVYAALVESKFPYEHESAHKRFNRFAVEVFRHLDRDASLRALRAAEIPAGHAERRRYLADASHQLGDLEAIARWLETTASNANWPEVVHDRFGRQDMEEFHREDERVNTLRWLVELPENAGDDALHALLDPTGVHYHAIIRSVCRSNPDQVPTHPIVARALLPMLTNATTTGRVLTGIEDGRRAHYTSSRRGSGSRTVEEPITPGPIEETHADRAAYYFSRFDGIPSYHPLLPDAAERLATILQLANERFSD